MIAADAIAVWQYWQISAPAQRLSETDRVSHAIVRVHLDVDTFRGSMAALASSHDTHQFSAEAASIRRTFLQHVDHAEQMLSATPGIEQGVPISSALETLRETLLSQLDTAVQLSDAGEWNAIQLRLANQIAALIDFSSSLVEGVDQQALQQRRKAIEDGEKARQRLFIIVPIAALVTLLAAATLGWYLTRAVTGPLRLLTAGAEAMARGDFQHKVHLGGNNELAVLGNAFDYASLQLQKLYEDLWRSERELRGVINTVPALVWRASPDGTIDFINERLLEFVGLSSDGIAGWNWESVLHPDDRTKFVSNWHTVRDGQSIESEVRVRRTNGEHCWFFVRTVPLRDDAGKVIKWYGSGIEIADRKRAEEERERLRQLEADLAHINRVSMLGEMAASLAHEIKQPIAAAINSANSCIEWLAHEPPNLDRARASATRIDQYGNRAAEIIDRIRSLYKKSLTQRELVDVNGIIEELLALLKCEADRYSIAMRTELRGELPKIVADRVQLQQVFMNLMLNAVEAMKDSGGELTIRSQREDSQLQFSVSDTGVGLPPERVDQIFSAFFTTKPQGSGMGLAISRSIVESHGGRLWATVNDGRGATFHFTLPIQVTEPSPLAA
jgi:PAS domain S-box-containing protein